MVIGSEFTWHGAPDCHCDVTDLLNLDRVEKEESDTESPGAKTLVEGKPRRLGPRHLYQTMGNAVTYRYNRPEPISTSCRYFWWPWDIFSCVL